MTNAPTIELPPTAGQPPTGPPKHRRRRWTIWAAALSAFAVALSLSLYFVLRDNTAQPTAAGPSATPSPTASTPAAVPSNSASATASTVPSTAASPANPAPDGRIALDVLKNATLVIPPWPADNVPGPSGPIKFTNGVAEVPAGSDFPSIRHMTIDQVRYGDVDRDGAAETVAAIGLYVQGGSQQLVAFDRDASGRIVTLGSVLSTTGAVRSIDVNNFRVDSNGVITGQVGDYAACCGDRTPTQHQWRSYAWTGNAFRQVGGPTAFPVNPAVAETAIRTSDLVLGPATNGVRLGTLTVKVSYSYGAVPDHLSIGFTLTSDLRRDGTAWPPTRTWFQGFAVDVRTPAAGTSATYTFAFSQTPVSGTSPGGSITLFGSTRQGTQLSESNLFNNLASINVRTVG